MGLFSGKKENTASNAGDSGAAVKVLGTGCARCRELDASVRSVIEELGLPLSVEHITDFPSIAAYGVMSMPALVVNGKVVVCGRVPDRNELKKLLSGVAK